MTGDPAGVRVLPAEAGKPFRDFLHLPYRIYREDPNWVAPLLRDVRTMFDRARHPFHRHSEVQPFLAVRDGEPVGRIAAIHNRNHISFHGEPVGFFGFFESVEEESVAGALFDAAGHWLRERGLAAMRGPTSFSTNEVTGLLVEGFDRPPVILMPYNPPWYVRLVEAAGFREARTLLAYVHDDQRPPEYLLRASETLSRRYGVSIRGMRVEEFDRELERVRAIYNEAWEKNWGFVPMTDAEFDFMAHELKPAVRRDPQLVIFADDAAGEAIGFALCVRDYNVAIAAARGRLLPFGIFKILWNSRAIHRARVLTLGVRPEHRGKGIDALLYLAIFRRGAGSGITEAEFSWILEDNEPMRRALERIGARVYKRYRVYERPLR